MENVLAGSHPQDILLVEVLDADSARCLLFLCQLTVMVVLLGCISVYPAEPGFTDIRVCVWVTVWCRQAASYLAAYLCDFEHLLLLIVPYLLDVLSSCALTDLNHTHNNPWHEERNDKASDQERYHGELVIFAGTLVSISDVLIRPSRIIRLSFAILPGCSLATFTILATCLFLSGILASIRVSRTIAISIASRILRCFVCTLSGSIILAVPSTV